MRYIPTEHRTLEARTDALLTVLKECRRLPACHSRSKVIAAATQALMWLYDDNIGLYDTTAERIRIRISDLIAELERTPKGGRQS